MLKGLFKPKWQHRKPAVRLQALVSLDGSSDALIDLATSDPDMGVRLGAIQRLQHIPTLKQLANDEPASSKLAEHIKQRVTELTLTQPQLTALETVYYLIDDPQVHQKIVCDPQHCSAIRVQALENIDDQALLFQVANTDQSRKIQFLAATKITDYKQLQKLKRLTKTNKKFRQLLKQKNAQYQQQQDFLQRIDTICQSIEALADNVPTDPKQQTFTSLKKQWQQLQQNTQHTIATRSQQRFEQAVATATQAYTDYAQAQQQYQPLRDEAQTVLQALDDLSHALLHSPNDFSQQEFMTGLQNLTTKWQRVKQQLPENEYHRYALPYEDKVVAIEETLTALDKDFQTLAKMQQLCADIDQLLTTKQALTHSMISELEKRWQQIPTVFTLDASAYQRHYAETLHKTKQRLAKQIEQQENAEKEIEALLTKVEQGIEKDQFKGAIKAYHQANKRLKEARVHLKKPTLARLQRRMGAVTPEIRQAESWRHWGTDKAREQLTEQVTRLINDTELDPLQRAKQVKTFRHEWKKLGKMDPSRHQRLWHEFDAACTKAYEPCQQYFKGESKQREKNLEQRQQICHQLECLAQETDWDTIDWRVMAKTINNLQGKWRKAGNVNRATWKAVNQRFNDAMDGLEIHLSKERRRNWLQRQQLISQAEAVLAQLNHDMETIETTVTDNKKKQQAIEQAFANAMQAGKELQAQWQPTITAKRAEEQKLWQQFRTAIDAVYERQRNERDAIQNTLQANLQQQQALLNEAEAIVALQGEELLSKQHQFAHIEEQFYPLPALPKNMRQKIDQAFSTLKTQLAAQKKAALHQRQLTRLLALANTKNNATSTATVDKNTLGQALKLLLELEILLGLDTPKDYQQERMAYQVGRLSEHMLMASKEQKSDEEQALQKIEQWYGLPPVEGDMGLIMQERFAPIQQWLENQVNR